MTFKNALLNIKNIARNLLSTRCLGLCVSYIITGSSIYMAYTFLVTRMLCVTENYHFTKWKKNKNSRWDLPLWCAEGMINEVMVERHIFKQIWLSYIPYGKLYFHSLVMTVYRKSIKSNWKTDQLYTCYSAIRTRQHAIKNVANAIRLG